VVWIVLPIVDALAEQLRDSRAAFAAAVGPLRPRLHRFCAGMTRSAVDAEDIVQDALAQAFYRLPTLRESTSLERWIFRIAHNKCTDFLRRRGRDVIMSDEHEDLDDGDALERAPDVTPALATLVTKLPPKERACVLLKDVLEHPLEEVAEIVGSTVGAVKSALHRGRAKLESGEVTDTRGDAGEQRLLAEYVERFNRRDWDAVRALVREDARVEVLDGGEGRGHAFLDSAYFRNYASLSDAWRLRVAIVDGETLIVQDRRDAHGWHAHAVVRVEFEGGVVVRIRDYVHVDYLLMHARVTPS
jgi:RNA polymerase sigma-70 factor (ECF subfamily)